ncbi:MAG: efflux RND transporter periplasmic adaptor subunit [Myxococcales bacterium]|nr:efflux RND transporter periplasmic adaptor subunit [Myxococcales bacterium]
MDLVFSVPQGQVGALREGQPVRGAFDDCRVVFGGTVRTIEPALDSRTRSVRVKARIPSSDGLLAPGMGVNVRVENERVPDALVVPQAAIVRQGTRHRVFVVDKDNVVSVRDVRFGEFLTDGVEVLDGLAAGDVVVVAGHQKLMPGAPVAPRPYQATDNPMLTLGTPAGDAPCEF